MPTEAARDADPPRSPDAPIHQSRERSLRRGAPLPRGVHVLACASQVGTKLRDCHQSKQLTLSGYCKPLTCTFAPLAGLEPATYGLEVDPRRSGPSRRVLFSLVRSGAPSADAALSCGVVCGGMTKGMTAPPRAWRRRLLHSKHLSQFGNGPRRPVRIACCNRHISYGMRILQRPGKSASEQARGQRGWRAGAAPSRRTVGRGVG